MLAGFATSVACIGALITFRRLRGLVRSFHKRKSLSRKTCSLSRSSCKRHFQQLRPSDRMTRYAKAAGMRLTILGAIQLFDSRDLGVCGAQSPGVFSYTLA